MIGPRTLGGLPTGGEVGAGAGIGVSAGVGVGVNTGVRVGVLELPPHALRIRIEHKLVARNWLDNGFMTLLFAVDN